MVFYLLAAQDTILPAGINLPPEWISTPVTSFIQGSPGEVYSLLPHVFDPEGDTLSFDTESSAFSVASFDDAAFDETYFQLLGDLPTGVTLVGSDLIIDASAPAVDVNISLFVSDGINPAVQSSVFNLTIIDDIAPIFNSTPPNPIFTGGTAGTYDFNNNITDDGRSAITWTYTGTFGSGISLNPNTGILSYDGIGANTITGPHQITATDAVGSDTSVVFYVEISSARWLGDNLSGELGALAINNGWDSTIYEYTSVYAPVVQALLGTIPEPTGAGDEYLMSTVPASKAALESILNNASYNKIFIKKGLDLSAFNDVTITQSGSAGTPRWITYWDDVTPGNVQDIKPWNLSVANRVLCGRWVIDNASYNNVVGLSWGAIGQYVLNGGLIIYRLSNNNIVYRCLGENNNFVPFQILAEQWTTGTDRPTDNWYYQCVARISVDPFVNPGDGTDVHGFATHGTIRAHIISCESYDMHGWNFQSVDRQCDELRVEDNDFYRTPAMYYDGSGNPDPLGDYAIGEGPIAFKYTGTSPASAPSIIRGNRTWGFQRSDPNYPAVAQSSSFQNTSISFTSPQKPAYRVSITENIFQDNKYEYVIECLGEHWEPDEGYHSFNKNLLYNNYWGGGCYAMPISQDKCEIYHNTIKGCDNIGHFYRADATNQNLVDIEGQDNMGNLYIDAGGFVTTQTLDSNCYTGYNGYVGTSAGQEFSQGYGAGTNVSEQNTANMNMGDFTYRRKKLTAPETATIPDVVPTSNTPVGFLTASPGSGHADQVGSRSGLGADDVILGTW